MTATVGIQSAFLVQAGWSGNPETDRYLRPIEAGSVQSFHKRFMEGCAVIRALFSSIR